VLTLLALRAARSERHQRQDAAFTVVVGAQHVAEVLDRDDDRHRPEDQRQHTEHVRFGRRDAVRAVQAVTYRVQRARADVAEHDAQRAERQDVHRRLVVVAYRGVRARGRC
jgi:hypothetical protein